MALGLTSEYNFVLLLYDCVCYSVSDNVGIASSSNSGPSLASLKGFRYKTR